MTYRDQSSLYRERIEQLEREHNQAQSRVTALIAERDQLRRELARVTHDPAAHYRRQIEQRSRRTLYRFLRVAGGSMLAVLMLPILLVGVALLFDGSPALAAMCAIVPFTILSAVLLLKLPEIVTRLEVRYEKKKAAAHQRMLAAHPAVRLRIEDARADEVYAENERALHELEEARDRPTDRER